MKSQLDLPGREKMMRNSDKLLDSLGLQESWPKCRFAHLGVHSICLRFPVRSSGMHQLRDARPQMMGKLIGPGFGWCIHMYPCFPVEGLGFHWFSTNFYICLWFLDCFKQTRHLCLQSESQVFHRTSWYFRSLTETGVPIIPSVSHRFFPYWNIHFLGFTLGP